MGQAWSRVGLGKASGGDNFSSTTAAVTDIDSNVDDGASGLQRGGVMDPNSASAPVHSRTGHRETSLIIDAKGPIANNEEHQPDDNLADRNAGATTMVAADVSLSSALDVSANIIVTASSSGISSAVATSDDPVLCLIHGPVLSWSDRQAILGASATSEDLSEEQKEAAAALQAEVNALNANIRELEAMEVWQTAPAQSQRDDHGLSTGASAADERPLNVNSKQPPSHHNAWANHRHSRPYLAAKSSVGTVNASKKGYGQSDGRESDVERRQNASSFFLESSLKRRAASLARGLQAEKQQQQLSQVRIARRPGPSV